MAKREKTLPQKLVAFLSSFGLAAVVLFFMLVITLLGTLAQTRMGIHDTTEKYFSSFLVLEHFGKLAVPLPGGFLLMGLLFVNVLLGALIKVRKRPAGIGMFIAHVSMLGLLLGGFVTHFYSTDGYMRVFEKGEANEYVDYTKWDLFVTKWKGDGAGEESLVIPWEQLHRLDGENRRVFTSKQIPFDVEVSHFVPNATPEYSYSSSRASGPVYDGFHLKNLPKEEKAEENIPGMRVRALDPAGGEELTAGLSWGLEIHPLTVTVGDETWGLRFDKRHYRVPFKLALDKFTKEDHPGIDMAAAYSSDVRKIEDGAEEDIRIWMNNPLRHRGYALFQGSFGPGENDPPGTGVYSVFVVVKNPADHWPLICCILVTIGLLIHFIIKLVGFLNRMNRQKAAQS